MPLIKARSSSIMNSVDLRGTPTTPTAAASTNTTQVASTAFVKTNIADLIASSPAALDTLNELAAAINNDASFATTVTNSLATKLALGGGTMTGALTLSGAPTANLHAATKAYVDQEITGITINSTDDLSEGVTNLYFTNARARSAISLSGNNSSVLSYNSTTGQFSFAWPTTDGILEGVSNLFYTTSRVRDAVSLTSNDSSILSYSSTTGVFTFTKPNTDKVAEGSTNLYHTTARARSSISAGSNISYDSTTGVISSTSAVSSVNGQTGAVVLSTDDVAEGSTNLYHTTTRARSAISLTTSDSTVLSYTAGTGVLTFTKPTTDGITEGSTNQYFTNARARTALSVTGNLTYNSSTGVIGFALSNHSTDDLVEGSTNQYFTQARARTAISLTGGGSILAYNSGTGVLTFTTPTTDGIAEGSTNQYFTNTRARSAVSASDAGGDGSFTYDSTTGVFTYTGPSAAEVRAHLSVTDAGGDGSLAYNSSTGVFTYTGPSAAEVRAHLSVTDAGGDGSLAYNSSTGVFTYTGPSAAEVRAHLSAGTGINYDSSTGVISTSIGAFNTDNIAEGSTNLYFTNARARAAISAGLGVSYNSSTGVISIGQAVGTSDNVTFAALTVSGNLTVNGTTTTVNSTIVSIDDPIFTLGGDTAPGTDDNKDRGIEFRWHNGTVAKVGFFGFDDSTGYLTFIPDATNTSEVFSGTAGDIQATNFRGALIGNVTGTVSSLSNHDTDGLVEGSTNLYFTNARARSAVSVTDAGGDGSFTYDSATGVFTYTGPSAAEVRAHVSATTATGVSYNSSTGVISLASIPNSSLTNNSVTVNGTSIALGGSATLTTDDVGEGSTNQYFTNARVRNAVSALDAGGDGSLAYNSSTGVFTYTGPSAAEVRNHFSVSGNLTYNSGTGVIGFALASHSTDDLAEGVTNQYFTTPRARSAVSLGTSDTTVLSYSASTGLFTFDLANVNTDKVVEGATNQYFTTGRARSSISAGSNISYDSTTGVISTTSAVSSVNGQTGAVVLNTDHVAEGSTNQYFTNARARSAITVTSNDSNILAYNSGTGVLTFTKPNTDSIAEGSTNLYYTNARADARIAAASINDLADVSTSGLDDGYTLVWSTVQNQFVPQNVATTASTLTFTGDGATTSFSTGVEVSSINNTQVFINGLVQAPTYSYTLNTVSNVTSIVFTETPELNDYIFVRVTSTSSLTAGGILNEDSTVDGGAF